MSQPRRCLKCNELMTDGELLYHRECLNQLIRESAEEIKMLEEKKAKLEKELGLWPYGSD